MTSFSFPWYPSMEFTSTDAMKDDHDDDVDDDDDDDEKEE